MLILKRMIHPYEVRKCKLSDEFIVYGDYFYEDDEDGTIIKATVYKKLQQEARNEAFDYSLLARAQNEKEYKELMKRAEKEYLNQTILDRPVFDQGHLKKNGIE